MTVHNELVTVIGGGSVAIDAARTARRLGSEEVCLVCLETLDLKSRDRMPALDWEISEAEEEGILIHPSLGIREIIVKNGKAVGIQTKRCTSVREPDGKFDPQYDETSETDYLTGESIVVAIGQIDDQSLAQPSARLTGIFAGGDMVSGSSTVIQAIASAQKSVREIEAFLNICRLSDKRDTSEYAESCFENIPRVKVREIPVQERLQNLNREDVPDLSLVEIEAEARRCINCGYVHEGVEAPLACPACAHPQAYYEVLAENW